MFIFQFEFKPPCSQWNLISIGMIAYFHIRYMGLMDKPAPLFTQRCAAGIL